MTDGSANQSVTEMVDEVRESWRSDDDPKVIVLDEERHPVIAAPSDDLLTVLHTHLVYAREITPDQISEELSDDDVEARIDRLSSYSDRFERSDFTDFHPTKE